MSIVGHIDGGGSYLRYLREALEHDDYGTTITCNPRDYACTDTFTLSCMMPDYVDHTFYSYKSFCRPQASIRLSILEIIWDSIVGWLVPVCATVISRSQKHTTREWAWWFG